MSTLENKELEESETKYIGGKVPIDLYWLFKITHTQRKESATEALNIALRLYLDVEIEKDDIIKEEQ